MKFSNKDVDIFMKIKKIQEKIENAQKKLELKEFTSQIGDILIVMQGTKQIIDIQIKNIEALNNLDLIQECLLLSFNDVLQQVEKASQELFIEASKEYEI
ncbi:YbaB/EbfC family nucleoid-associated protein [Candidatus Phytoplasma oryzae]|nr:YbaB/EbfC family nucleoid-associated protein [Candidatus Phytoplasma oryzae]